MRATPFSITNQVRTGNPPYLDGCLGFSPTMHMQPYQGSWHCFASSFEVRLCRQVPRIPTHGLRPGSPAVMALPSCMAVLDIARQAAAAAASPSGGNQKAMHYRWKFRFRSQVSGGDKERRKLHAQVLHHNRIGRARTQDHLLNPPSGKTGPFKIIGHKVKGKGAWKTWTADAVLRAGFKPGDVGSRTVAAELDGSHSHSRKCKQLVARVIIDGQQEGLRRLKTRAEHAPGGTLKFYIINTMFDETRLPVTVEYKGRQKHRIYPILSSDQQVYWSDGVLHEEDLIRRPVALRKATVACMWAALQGSNDRPPEGEAFFPPRSPSGLRAKWEGVLISGRTWNQPFAGQAWSSDLVGRHTIYGILLHTASH